MFSGIISMPSDVRAQECPIQVTDMLPDGFASIVRPAISATLTSKCGNDIDVKSVKMVLDNAVVPCVVSGSGSKISVKFTPETGLSQESDHFVIVEAKDAKGVTVKKEWSFWLGLIY
jgi:hypothetical protein